MRPHDSYTVVIFHHLTKVPRQISIKKRTVAILCLLCLGLIAAQLLFVSHFWDQRQQLAELTSLKTELEISKTQASAAQSAIQQLRFQLAGMKEFTTKVREMLGLEPDAMNMDSDLSGQGGEEEISMDVPLRQITSPRPILAAEWGGIHAGLQMELRWLASDAVTEHRDLQTLVETVKNRRARWEATPSIWPVKGWVTSGFGPRVSPFTGRVTHHKGVDIRAPAGTPVLAPAAGTVVKRRRDGGFGNTIALSHGAEITTQYAHLSSFTVKVGQRVKRGDMIGRVGNTGLSTGPHLHYEVSINKAYVDPRDYILD